MRILVVGDTHGDLAWVCNEVIPAAIANDCPTIMQLGDFGFVWDRSIHAVETTLAPLSQALILGKRRLVFLPGNHENHPMLAQLCRTRFKAPPEMFFEIAPSVFYTGRVAGWVWSGQTLVALGGAVSVDRAELIPGLDWWPEEQLTSEEVLAARRLARRLPRRRGRIDVLFSHDGPTNVPLTLYLDFETEMHRMRISDVARALKPRQWFHGHYHFYARYEFPCGNGWRTTVTALDCNRRPHSMAVLELEEVA